MEKRLLRLRQVLDRIPLSKSAWYEGVAAGKYPRPLRLGARTSVWRESDIDALIERTSTRKEG